MIVGGGKTDFLLYFSDVPNQGTNYLRTHGPLGLISLGPVLVEHTQLGQQICVVPSCRVRERVDMHDSRQEAMRQMTECSQKTQNDIINHPVQHAPLFLSCCAHTGYLLPVYFSHYRTLDA
jgi:hypothetical protein